MNQRLILQLLSVSPLFTGSLKLAHTIYYLQANLPKDINFNYEYKRGVRGPHSEQIYDDLKYLEDQKLIKTTWVYSNNSSYRGYSLTELGLVHVRNFGMMPNLFLEISSEFGKMNQEDVVRKIYYYSKLSRYEIGDRMLL